MQQIEIALPVGCALCSRHERVTKLVELRHRAKSACGDDNDEDDDEDDDVEPDDDDDHEQLEADIPLAQSPAEEQDAMELIDTSADTLSCDDDDADVDLEHLEEAEER